MPDLSGRTALVTGASKGIGAAIAADLARAGARVAVNYGSDAQGAQAVVDRITSGGGAATAVHGDISREEDVQRMFADVRSEHGPIDVLVNNAGVWNYQPLQDITVDEYRRHYDVNVLGNVLTSREFARQADLEGGAIVNLSSIGIESTNATTGLYVGTKMAIVGMTRVFAVELAPRGIRVNAIAAGLVDTEGTRATGFIGSPAADAVIRGIPQGRMGQPDDIAPVATFLASDEARYITGDVIFPAGGMQLP